jgi:hypothetical protein
MDVFSVGKDYPNTLQIRKYTVYLCCRSIFISKYPGRKALCCLLICQLQGEFPRWYSVFYNHGLLNPL